MPKRFYKHKVLLDENMPPRIYFPRLNAHFDIKHIRHDLNLPAISDLEIYDLAVAQSRIILTLNIKHFILLAGTKTDAGIIGLTGSNWTSIDTRLTSLLIKHKASFFANRLLTLGGEELKTT